MRRACFLGLAYVLTGLSSPWPNAAAARQEPYDPLAAAERQDAKPLDLSVHDATRQREIPIRVYLPAEPAPAPVVLFSHGLGGSREGSAYLGRHWSARGYAVVFLQHPGSDASVWRDAPLGQRMAAMQRAAGAQNLLLRTRDVPAVLDQLSQWHVAAGHDLTGRLDMAKVGMSGHSFGAVTTQAVSGQRGGGGWLAATDPRIKAAVVMSPSGARRGESAEQAFAHVKIPWLLMTGTKDLSPIGGIDVASRLAVYPALPPGGKYELVLHEAEHSAFTERAAPGTKRNPNHHRVILALSTAFWDAYLRENAAARTWLDGDGPAAVLEQDDRWQRK